MNSSISKFFILLFLITSTLNKSRKKEKNRKYFANFITIVNETTYDKFLNENRNVFLNFMTANCKLCKKLRTLLKKIAFDSNTNKWNLKIGIVDGILNPNLSEKFNLQKDNYPSSFFLNNSEKTTTRYSGEYTYDAILSYLKYRMKYHVKEISSLNEIYTLIKKKTHCLLFVGDKSFFQNQFNMITNNYDELRQYLVVQTKNKEIMEHFNVSSVSFDVIFFNFIEHKDDEELDYRKSKHKPKNKKRKYTLDIGAKMNLSREMNLDKEIFLSILNLYRRPLVARLSDETLNTVFEDQVTSIFLISKNNQDLIPLGKLAQTLAPKYRSEIWFLVSSYLDQGNSVLYKNLKIKKSGLPAIVLFSHKKNLVDDIHKFIWSSDPNPIEESDIENFINSWKNNKLNRFYISQEIPKKQVNKAGIHKIVADNFLNYLENVNINLLLLICSPLCKKCERLEPVYELLSMKLKNNKNLVIGEIDPLTNEFEGIDVKQVPYLIFYPGGSAESRLKNQVKYNGNYTLSELVNFVEKNTNIKLDIIYKGKKENEFLKFELDNPVIKEGEEEYPLNFYSRYGKQRLLGQNYNSIDDDNEENLLELHDYDEQSEDNGKHKDEIEKHEDL